jgi:methyltransferase (TIGR00027 family)
VAMEPLRTWLNPVADTARWTAAARARESRRPDRLFHDPFAETLAGPDGSALLNHFHTERAAPDGNPFLAIRTRWFDDFLRETIPARGTQVVALGAGLDARAYRLAWAAGTLLFELDQPALLSYKVATLASAVPRCEVRHVPVNLADDWPAALLGAGLDRSRPTVWFAEGLLFYLSEPLAAEVLRRAAALSVPGSALAADLIGTGIFHFPYTRPFLRKLERSGSPWRFGTDDPAAFLASCGWHPTAVTEPGDPAANYGRWPARSNPGGFPGLPRSYLVSAAKR